MREASNIVMKYALEAASKYDRAIAVMYDLSGLAAQGEDCSSIIEDWKFLVDSLKVTNQPGIKTYLHYRDKPLVVIWGLGFPDRPYDIRNIGIERLINFLKNDPVYGGCSVMLREYLPFGGILVPIVFTIIICTTLLSRRIS